MNCVMKNPSLVDIRFAMCFPDVYEIGMSHLGIQILYSMFNSREDIYCERVYSPWMDLDVYKRQVEYRMRMKGDQYQWFRASAEVIRRLDGSASRIARIFINIDGEKKEIMQA